MTSRLGRGFRPAAVLGVIALGMASGPGPATPLTQARRVPVVSDSGPTARPPTPDNPVATVPSPTPSQSTGGSNAAPGTSQPRPQAGAASRSTGAVPPARPGSNAYVHYYLWWSIQHWHDKLGPAYPYTANPLPLPGSTDATGCNPSLRFPGATIVDLPSEGLYNQDLASTYDLHIATAAAAGVRGFVVSWMGDGTTNQTVSSSSYSTRLAMLAGRVDAYNAGHSSPFRLALGMSPYGNYNRSASAIINDLNFFSRTYGSDPAFGNVFSPKPLVMLLASRQFPSGTLAAVSGATRAKLFLLGDETASSWPNDGPLLDGTSYYWSSESPSSYARDALVSLGNQVHAAGKLWFSPFTAGFGNQVRGGTCVPRNGVATMDGNWAVNRASRPDGWMGISWNEFVENTYLEPSLAYGATYLNELRRLIAAG